MLASAVRARRRVTAAAKERAVEARDVLPSGTALLGSSGQERGTTRILAFSDGVFAIAITLLILQIKTPADAHHLVRGLVDLWPSYLTYAFTFLLIGQVWVNHHVVFDHIRATDWGLMFWNIVLLANIAFLPFAASVLASALRGGADERAAVVFYGATFAIGSGLFNLTWHHACRAKLFGSTIDASTQRAMTRRFILGPPMYAAGVAVGALVPLLGLVLFAAPGAMFWIPVGTSRATAEGHATSNDAGH
jgi:uncharacterized membrane protein